MTTQANPTHPQAINIDDPPIFQTPHSRLEYLYKDVTRLSQVATPDIILHPADRDLHTPPRPPLVGIAAAQQHEENLVAATGGTLEMSVESIHVASDWSFGCVLGVLKAGSPCGLATGSGSGFASAVAVAVASGCRSGSEERIQGSGGAAGSAAVVDREVWERGGKGEEEEEVKGDGGKVDQDSGGKRKGPRGRIEMPFCGVWRFDESGRAIEHWENAAYPEALGKWLRGE